jgi:hypothetical protein
MDRHFHELEHTIAVAFSGAEPSDPMMAAQSRLVELRSNPETLPLFLATISRSQNAVVRRFCILTVDRFVRLSMLRTSAVANLLAEVVELITSESDYVNRMNLCVLASRIHLREGDGDGGDDDDPDPDPAIPVLLDFAHQLLSDPSSQAVAFYLLSQIARKPGGAGSPDLWPGLVSAGLEALLSPDRQLRVESLKYLSLLFWHVGSPIEALYESIPEFPALVEGFMGRLFGSDPDAGESTHFFDFMGVVCGRGVDCFAEHHRSFCELLAVALTNREVDPYVRLPAARCLDSVFEVSIDAIEDIVGHILEHSITFAVELCAAFPESNDFTFLRDHFETLAGLRAIDHESVCSQALELAGRLFSSTNDAELIVGLSIMDGLVLFKSSHGDDQFDSSWFDILATALEHANDEVASWSGKVILQLCEVLHGEITCEIDHLAGALLKRFSVPTCVKAIGSLMDNSSEPPDDIEELIMQVLELIAQASPAAQEDLMGSFRVCWNNTTTRTTPSSTSLSP